MAWDMVFGALGIAGLVFKRVMRYLGDIDDEGLVVWLSTICVSLRSIFWVSMHVYFGGCLELEHR